MKLHQYTQLIERTLEMEIDALRVCIAASSKGDMQNAKDAIELANAAKKEREELLKNVL